jgi:TolB-like protein
MSLFNELKRRNVFRVGIAYTVATWLLIQVTDTVFPRIGLPDSAVTLVIALLAIGFIPALIFAWAFEMTPEGLKREKDIDRSQSITPETGKNLNRMIIGGLALVIVVMAIERTWFAGQDEELSGKQTVSEVAIESSTEQDSAAKPVELQDQAADERESVAVLPFVSMSSGEDDGYFADGLTEEILNSLARLPELLVTARTSSFHFKGKDLPIPEIAAALGVDHVVEGSVRRAGEEVRITAQLIRADDGFHLWSNTYDRTLEDVFEVQEDIAENIAGTLNVVLNEDNRQRMRDARINDVEAFIVYQKAIEAFGSAHSTGNPGLHLEDANMWFDQALEIVPDLINALYLRTDLFGHKLYSNASNLQAFSNAELREALSEIYASLDKAWLSADSAAQRAILDAERTMFTENWSEMGAKLDKAFEKSECMPLNWLPALAAPNGWASQAAAFERDLVRCDPLRALPAVMHVNWEIWNGNAEQAVDFADNYLRAQGFNPWLDDGRFQALLSSGRYKNDTSVFDPNPNGSVFELPRSIYVHAKNNEIETAREILDNWLSDNTASDLAMLHIEAVLGNREAANHYAGLIDARIGGSLVLIQGIQGCYCGAPFDLEHTPTFKKRIDEAGFKWPPFDPTQYPAKDW